jgi:hypothetical protein
MSNAVQQVYEVTTEAGFLDLDVGFLPAGLFITAENNSIRVAYDGTLPAPDEGHIVFPGQFFSLNKASLIQRFAMVATTGTATVTVTLES